MSGEGRSTNLLPLKRINLAIGEEARVRAAWLHFPSLKLDPLAQFYRRIDERTYYYETMDVEFTAHLQVNDVGFVTLYPRYWQAIAHAGCAYAGVEPLPHLSQFYLVPYIKKL